MKKPKEYRPPSLTKYGDVEQITAGNSYGSYTDRSFPEGVPKGELTFSASP